MSDHASIKTVDLTPEFLTEDELKALRRRMKKSYQWIPTTGCIKRELQMHGRWPLQSTDRPVRRKRKAEKVKSKHRRQTEKARREHPVSRKVDEKRTQELRKQKSDAKVRYNMPVGADEPTYCYCGDVSYGEMIACENEVIPWLDLLIVGLPTRMVSS